MELPQFVHQALIAETRKDRLVGHIARDSTAIPARERLPGPAAKQDERARQRRGKKRGPHRRYQGGKAPNDSRINSRLHKQRSMKLEQMLADLPAVECSIGVKRSNDGNQQDWRGCKLRLDVADGRIPIAAMLASASLHGSQAAIPLATMTARRVTNLYDVMDSACHAAGTLEHSRDMGHRHALPPYAHGIVLPPPK